MPNVTTNHAITYTNKVKFTMSLSTFFIYFKTLITRLKEGGRLMEVQL